MKENAPVILGIGFMVICAICGMLSIMSSFKSEPPVKNELKCSEIIYFNKNKHNYDTTYTKAVYYGDDSLVNFTDPNGMVWQSKQIVKEYDKTDNDSDGDNYTSEWDVTINTGEVFKISVLQDGGCGLKSEMDSLIKSNN